MIESTGNHEDIAQLDQSLRLLEESCGLLQANSGDVLKADLNLDPEIIPESVSALERKAASVITDSAREKLAIALMLMAATTGDITVVQKNFGRSPQIDPHIEQIENLRNMRNNSAHTHPNLTFPETPLIVPIEEVDLVDVSDLPPAPAKPEPTPVSASKEITPVKESLTLNLDLKRYLATSNVEAEDIAYQLTGAKRPGVLCMPLAADILKQSFGLDLDPSKFYEMTVSEFTKALNGFYTREDHKDIKTSTFDFSSLDYHVGDSFFLRSASAYGHMVVIERIDSNGDVYVVSNVRDVVNGGYKIEEVKIISPSDPASAVFTSETDVSSLFGLVKNDSLGFYFFKH